MYKKLLTALLCLAMLLTIVACNRDGAPASTTAATTTEATTTIPTTTAATTAATTQAATTQAATTQATTTEAATTAATTTATTTVATTTVATTQAPVTTAPVTTAPATTAPVTTAPTPEELKAAELMEYLSGVTYLDFELTGESAPYFMGRWFEKEIGGASHMVTTTDGSLFYFLVDGADSFNVNFTKISETDTIPYFAYSIDGATPVRQSITNKTVTLPDDKPHTVRIIADCLNAYEAKWEREIGFALKDVTASDGGAIYGIKPNNKVVFYYGDSITQGLYALGAGSQSNNSAINSYAWNCSEALGAVHYSIGYSGTGITLGVEEGKSFARFDIAIDHLSKDRLVDTTIKPDVIVINHGCNDRPMNTNPLVFLENLKAGLVKLQEMYPDVPIYVVVPFDQTWGTKMQTMINKTELDNIYLIKTEGWVTDEMCVDETGHLSADGAKTVGEKLAVALKDALGEDFFN